MAPQRGDVVLMPFPFSDLSTTNLRYPSAFKPVLATLEPRRVLYQVGALSPMDLAAVTQRVRQALDL